MRKRRLSATGNGVANKGMIRMQTMNTEEEAKTNGHIKNLAGQKFGRLEAIQMTDFRDKKGSVVWLCRCDCKTVVYVTEDNLVSGKTKSCGCRKQEINDDFAAQKQLHFVDGTCVEWIKSRKHRADNTSGFRGVSWRKKQREWSAYIGFKGKRYNLGYHDSFSEAVKARLKAEEEIYRPFLEQYYEQSKVRL